MASVGQHVVTGRRCRAGGLRPLGWWMTNGRWSEPAACAAAHEGFTGAAGQEAGARRGQARATGRLCWSAVVINGPAAGGAIVGGFNLVHVGKPLFPSPRQVIGPAVA